jgi:2-C-methyl-D-erythritol 4-phosphate cytidylyltransferase
MIYAAILAGGVGKRVERYTIPKQFILLSGKPILIRSLEPFVANKRFDGIYVAVHKDWIHHMEALLEGFFSEEERAKIVIVEGGKERLDSFSNIVEAILEKRGLQEEDILICHDSVRPFVRQQMIQDCIEATLEDGLALTVVPTTDTIHIAQDDRYISGTLDRNGLYNGQTPSGFNIRLLKSALDRFSEEDKKKVTGTTQLMLKLGYKLRLVKGHTSNFKITTDNDLDVAERMLRSRRPDRKIALLDCTLRDGGIVLDFRFGKDRMQAIKGALETSGVDLIECGYIDERKGSSEGRTCFDNEQSIEKNFLFTGKKAGIQYVAMIDYGTFDVQKLHPATKEGIDGIRLAFHKEHWREAIQWGKTILSKGYDLYIQPMVTMRYSDEEFFELIRACNTELSSAKGFYVVDSFGQMDSMALSHWLEIADANVSSTMWIGFHAHNNRQMAFSNAKTFLAFPTNHSIMLDASIMGMGKGAGNLCTELIEASLGLEGKDYQTTVLYDIISEYFANQQKETPWGYSLDYYLSSLYSCTPSYIRIFTSDSRVTTDLLVEMLKNMPEEKRAACDRTFAQEYKEKFLKTKEKQG